MWQSGMPPSPPSPSPASAGSLAVPHGQLGYFFPPSRVALPVVVVVVVVVVGLGPSK